jgi:hypothetical protein
MAAPRTWGPEISNPSAGANQEWIWLQVGLGLRHLRSPHPATPALIGRLSSLRSGCGERGFKTAAQQQRENATHCRDSRMQSPELQRRHALEESAEPANGDIRNK